MWQLEGKVKRILVVILALFFGCSTPSKKSVDIPKGKFEVVIDDKYGWFYWQSKGVWYGMEKDDDIAPPFEY